MENVLAILLAGGAGERLYPLTRDTAKPAVPFGGAYRIIDFTLSNCINSDVRRIFILTQYKSLELIRHVRDGWNILSPELGEYIEVHSAHEAGPRGLVPGHRRRGLPEFPEHRGGSARAHPDPLRRPHLQDELPRDARLAPRAAGRYHHRHHPGAPRRRPAASACAEIDDDYRIVGFEEKPQHGNPVPLALRPRHGQRLDGDLRLQHRCAAARRCTRTRRIPNSTPRFRQGRDSRAAWHAAA